jgi:hypothetical protein
MIYAPLVRLPLCLKFMYLAGEKEIHESRRNGRAGAARFSRTFRGKSARVFFFFFFFTYLCRIGILSLCDPRKDLERCFNRFNNPRVLQL